MKIKFSELYSTHHCIAFCVMDPIIGGLNPELTNSAKEYSIKEIEKNEYSSPMGGLEFSCAGTEIIHSVLYLLTFTSLSGVIGYLLAQKNNILQWQREDKRISRGCQIEFGDINISFDEKDLKTIIKLLESIEDIRLEQTKGIEIENLTKAQERISQGYIYDALPLIGKSIPPKSEINEEFLFIQSNLNELKKQPSFTRSQEQNIRFNKLLLRLIEIIEILKNNN